jgi:hypothetical protein
LWYTWGMDMDMDMDRFLKAEGHLWQYAQSFWSSYREPEWREREDQWVTLLVETDGEEYLVTECGEQINADADDWTSLPLVAHINLDSGLNPIDYSEEEYLGLVRRSISVS